MVEIGSPEIEKAGREPLPGDARADRVEVVKSERVLRLLDGETVLKEYRVALGFEPVGDKKCQGDGKTPEGAYVLNYRNPGSRFHKSIHISYPNDADRAQAEALGCPPGGDVMIHGLGPEFAHLGRRHVESDWTLGCIAVTDSEIEEIWRALPDGTPITIRP